MTKTALTLRYHWKAVLGWGVAGVVAVGVLVAAAQDTPEQPPDCRWSWNDESFHDRTNVAHIQWCIREQHVDVNQTDEQGRTLLHRLAREQSTIHRRALVELLLGVEGIDLEVVDARGFRALHYALDKLDRWPTAALLLDAGAQRVAPADPLWRAEKLGGWPDVARHLAESARNPFEEGVDLDALSRCRTVDCFLDEALKE